MTETLGAAGWEDNRELPKVRGFRIPPSIPRSVNTTSGTVRTRGAWQVAHPPRHPAVLEGLVYTVSERVVVFDPVTWTTEDIGKVIVERPPSPCRVPQRFACHSTLILALVSSSCLGIGLILQRGSGSWGHSRALPSPSTWPF